MSKPYIHARSSAKKFGGEIEDYVDIHEMMDSSKAIVASNAHRAMLHHSFDIFLMQQMFGVNYEALDKLCEKHGISEECKQEIVDWKRHCISTGKNIKNADGKQVSVRDVAEQHCLEDNMGKFIASAADYIQEMDVKPWMNNAASGLPPSCKNLYKKSSDNQKHIIGD